ncbi:DUF1761 domain-containing protein [Rhodophyticola sp. CCM32]|uniref:DUF1761 domain-containing protein n=1 Tax=Rhodophyticola sp. CCM32 TaxID=2916397 RepID=UPI00107F0237|nr:DUF1761 domain-containing protein [Rhodophyticola sp. CCM32]QBX99780.1 DUF1761 domain-containing protein [Rhodophyticola sp. CCM32]
MTIPETLNWLAVIVGTAVAFGAGWLWYGPLFGRVWASGSGMSEADRDSIPMLAMVLQLAGLFLLALVIGVTATTEALGTALLAILAVAVLLMSAGAFMRKSTAAMLIDGFYAILAGVVMIAAQGIF